MSASQATPDAAAEKTTVRVELGERSYDILIGPGLIAETGPALAALHPGIRVAVVTDETVAGIHLPALRQSLEAAGIDHVVSVVAPGEGAKSFGNFERLCDEVLAARLERGDAVVALGGGVVGDLSGFVSGVVRRGMRFVQVPTTLLSQVDSSVGGKTGINCRHGKNLIGVFQQPRLVVADTATLDTLSKREFRAGYAEVAKYGLIDDFDFFSWLEASWGEVFAGGAARTRAIAASCRAKAAVVAGDERETGRRALLNLGHTFGHALEAATGFSQRLVHGEGVAIGMVLAFRFSARLGLANGQDAERVRAHLAAVGLPTEISHIEGTISGADELMAHIAQDKKVKRGKLTFILARGIGQSFIADDVAPDAVRAFLEDELKR
ncbi:MAG TPA: 3-dehydroquinate synthase [Kaistiaceae bacterium]|mgnify:CR=1 FL=1|nr:3-dehydroquinate synthase [Kaistiaceae bacterium]